MSELHRSDSSFVHPRSPFQHRRPALLDLQKDPARNSGIEEIRAPISCRVSHSFLNRPYLGSRQYRLQLIRRIRRNSRALILTEGGALSHQIQMRKLRWLRELTSPRRKRKPTGGLQFRKCIKGPPIGLLERTLSMTMGTSPSPTKDMFLPCTRI